MKKNLKKILSIALTVILTLMLAMSAFAVSLDEIKAEVRKNFDKTVEWIDVPEAEQYRQSLLIK